MRVKEYLQKKYKLSDGATPVSLTKTEARIFGVSYPLINGWLQKCGELVITDGMAYRLRASQQDRAKAGKAYAKEAVAVLEAIPAPAKTAFHTNPPLTKKQKRKARLLARQVAVADGTRSPNPPRTRRLTIPTESSVKSYIANSSINPASDEFLSSFEWRAVRMMALKLHGARCQCCGASPATGAVMNVDHIKPRKFFPQLALDVNNLQVLCHDCNHGSGNWSMTDWRGESPRKAA